MEKVWLAQYPKGVPQEIDIRSYSSILDVFDRSVQRFSERPAFTNMGVTLKYADLDQMSRAFASYLQNELKLKKGDRIAIQLPNLLQFPVALFGALRAGLVIVNTNPLYTEREMKHQFIDAGCKAIVVLANFAKNLENILEETPIEHVILTELGDLLGFPKKYIVNSVVKHVKKMVPPFHLPDAVSFNEALRLGRRHSLKAVDMNLDDTAFLQYTGGTTGVSKGAMLTHRNIVANMKQIHDWIAPKLKEGEEVAVCALPMYHIFCLTVNGLTIVEFGAHNIMITNPRDIPAFVKELKKHPFSVMVGLNTLFNALMNNKDFASLDFSNVRVNVSGGMALQKAVALRWKDITGTGIVEGYGLTETSPVVTVNPIDGSGQLGSIGLPLPSTNVKVVDEDGKELGFDEPGELCVQGPQVMKGYWQRQEETDKVMLPGGWLRTGDMACIQPDGYVRIVDRKKDMILVSGFNVYPNEVEDVIAAIPGVVEVAAIGIADERSGEAVKVFVVKNDESLTAEKIIAHARSNLAAYKVPKHVEFRKELPKTNVGKILRRALRT